MEGKLMMFRDWLNNLCDKVPGEEVLASGFFDCQVLNI